MEIILVNDNYYARNIISLTSNHFIFITITQQPEQERWAENQPTAGLSSLNEYEYENGMRRSKTELSLMGDFYDHLVKNTRDCVQTT